MKRIILIDGENFIYGLRALAGTEEKLASRDLFFNFPFRKLLEEVVGNKPKDSLIYYYGARLRQYDYNAELLKKTKRAIKFQLKLVNNLNKQNIKFVKAGYLRARETDPCPNCGKNEWKLLEKGVDVGLAVQLVADASPTTEIVLVSSDTDLLPAVQMARSKGANIMFVGYESKPILALVKATQRTRTITVPMVEKYLKKLHG